MKKLFTLLVATLGLYAQSALAAHIGWYQFDATWRDGQFSGQLYYDDTSPYRVTEVRGTLVDLAQTTAINKVWNLENAQPESWLFLANTNPADMGGHDAGFYLTLLDLGATLTLDTSVSNGLFDWSNDTFYNPAQLDDSPLQAFSINAIPIPGTALLVMAGLVAMGTSRRVKPQRG